MGKCSPCSPFVKAGLMMHPVMGVTLIHSTWIFGILGSFAHLAHTWSLTRHEPAMRVSHASTTELLMFPIVHQVSQSFL